MRRITERRARIYALILMTGLLTLFLWIGFLAIKGAGGPIHTSFGTYYAASTLAATGHAELAYLAPSTGETARGISGRVTRAAKRMGRTVETWVTDGVVYFKVS